MGGYFSKSYYVSEPAEFATATSAETVVLTTVEQAAKEYKAYDYIIVGAGTFSVRSPLLHDLSKRATGACGAVLASRLSEDPNVTVLLVEAGTRYVLAVMLIFCVPLNLLTAMTLMCSLRYLSPKQSSTSGC
jgi:hypothetical protein